VNGVSVAPSSTLATHHFDLRLREPAQCSTVQPNRRRAGAQPALGFRDPAWGRWAIVDDGREQRLRRSCPPPTRRSRLGGGIDYTLPLPGQVDDPSRSDPLPPPATRSRPRPFGGRTCWPPDGVLEALQRRRPLRAVPCERRHPGEGRVRQLRQPGRAVRSGARQLREPRLVERSPLPAFRSRPASRWAASSWSARDLQADRKIAFDVRGDVTWFGAGRDYSQVSDMLGKLTTCRVRERRASLGIYGRFASWARLRVYGTLGIDSSHFSPPSRSART